METRSSRSTPVVGEAQRVRRRGGAAGAGQLLGALDQEHQLDVEAYVVEVGGGQGGSGLQPGDHAVGHRVAGLPVGADAGQEVVVAQSSVIVVPRSRSRPAASAGSGRGSGRCCRSACRGRRRSWCSRVGARRPRSAAAAGTARTAGRRRPRAGRRRRGVRPRPRPSPRRAAGGPARRPRPGSARPVALATFQASRRAVVVSQPPTAAGSSIESRDRTSASQVVCTTSSATSVREPVGAHHVPQHGRHHPDQLVERHRVAVGPALERRRGLAPDVTGRTVAAPSMVTLASEISRMVKVGHDDHERRSRRLIPLATNWSGTACQVRCADGEDQTRRGPPDNLDG